MEQGGMVRSVPSLFVISAILVVILFDSGCPAPACRDDNNCPVGAPFCVAGVCSADTAEGEGEEGEGEEGEGEGEIPFTPERVGFVSGFTLGEGGDRVFDVAFDGVGGFVVSAALHNNALDGTGVAFVNGCPGDGPNDRCNMIIGLDGNGTPRWFKRLGDDLFVNVDMAVAGGVVFVVGRAATIATGAADETVVTDDAFIAGFDVDDGAIRFVHPLQAFGISNFTVVARGAGAVFTGSVQGVDVDIGGSLVTSDLGDNFIADIDGTGAVSRISLIGDTSVDLDVAADDTLVVFGSYSGVLTKDGVSLLTLPAGRSGFVLVLADSEDGRVVVAAHSQLPADNLDDVEFSGDLAARGDNGVTVLCSYDFATDLIALTAWNDAGAVLHSVVLDNLVGCTGLLARDDGFLFAGLSESFGAGGALVFGDDDEFIVDTVGGTDVVWLNLDATGAIRSAQSLSSPLDDAVFALHQTADRSRLVAAGALSSPDLRPRGVGFNDDGVVFELSAARP